MDEPLVCCILPYHTPEYFVQAVRCFHSQTYEYKELIAADTSRLKITIGAIRNNLVSNTTRNCLIAHWDHDDWSAPDRLAQQVEVMRAHDCAITGYHDLPFYDVDEDRVLFYQSNMTGYAVGTSLLYRREVWERTPFPDKSMGEDASWQHAVRRQQGHAVVSTSSVVDGKPLMVGRMHGGNTCKKFGNNYTAASPELERAVRACIAPSIVAQ